MKPNKEVHHKKNGRIFDLSQNKHKASLPLPLREHQVQHNVSYIIAFEVLLILIRNQKNAVGMWLNYGLGPQWVPVESHWVPLCPQRVTVFSRISLFFVLH